MNIEELKREIKTYDNINYRNASAADIQHMNDVIDDSNNTSIMIGHPNDILFIAMEEIVEFLDAVKNVEENNYPDDMDNEYLINFAEEFTDVRIAIIKVIRYLGQKYGIEPEAFSYLNDEFTALDTNRYGKDTTTGKLGYNSITFEELYNNLIKMHSAISKYARMNNYTTDEDQITIISNLLNSCVSVYAKMLWIGSGCSRAMVDLMNKITDIKIERQRRRDAEIKGQ